MEMFLAQVAAAPDILGVNAMTTNIQAQGAIYQTNAFRLALTLFPMFGMVGAGAYALRYQSANGGSLHGVENQLFEILKVLGISYGILVLVGGGVIPQIANIAMWICRDVTGVVITGPADIIAIAVNLCPHIVAQPANGILVAAAQAPAAQLPGINLPATTLPIPGAQIMAGAEAVKQHAGQVAQLSTWTVVATAVSWFVAGMFAFMALEYIVAIANIAIVVGWGSIQMGLASTPWGKPKSDRFYDEAYAAGARLATVAIVVSFIGATMGLWGNVVQTTDLEMLTATWTKLIIGSIICAGLAWQLPRLAAKMFGGSADGGAADGVRPARAAVNSAQSAGSAVGGAVSKGVKRG
jgi:hypothetical protein